MVKEMHFPQRYGTHFFRMNYFDCEISYQPNVEWKIPLKEQKKKNIFATF